MSIAAFSAACSFLAPPDADLLGGRGTVDAGGRGGVSFAGAGEVGSGASGVPGAGGGGGNGNAAGEGGASSAGADNEGALAGRAGAPAVTANIPLESLILWLRADRGVHLTDGAIDTWADQSGAGRHAFKNIAGQRPKLSAAASNGLSQVVFDGIDDDLALPEVDVDFSAGLTFFASVSQVTDSECSAVLQLSNGAEIDDIDFSRVDASLSYEVVEQTVEGVKGAYALDHSVLLGVVSRPDQTVDLRINGEFTNGAQHFELPSHVSRGSNFVARSLYGACSPFGGKIAEILLYARSLSKAEVAQVETYLRQKWGCCE